MSASGTSGASGKSGARGTSGTVERAFAAALHGDGDLDVGASLLAAAPSSDSELDARGREFVRRAWERGWQPADVLRMVVRAEGLDADHVRLAARLIRAEVGRYDVLPPRWAAQLDEAPGEDPARTDRFSAATRALELYRLLLRLPAIEPVGPVPGESVTVPVAGEPRTLARIRALLAKAEATGYPPEAEALTAKAQELMARHSVDEAVLASRTHAKDTPAACRIGVDAPYETAKAVLLDAVATANRCRAVWNSAFGFSTVVGFEADLEVVELLYTSLLVQADAAMTRAEAEQRAGGRKRTKTFRQSFLAAYAHRIGDRLAAVADQVVSGEGELLPVLAARDVAVAGRAEEMFPQTVTTRMRGVTDGAGWDEGGAAADRARIGGGASAGPGARGRLRGGGDWSRSSPRP
ncbi:DUF2786 domain-containing protein [Streptomyces sp. VRA16 Mangrove soil]|uniref:DUF2786 domain-containing protein n=1 Tax=Streptomyces sp. VRA16 Mangrove soil TaxID=2817434 RepID=UPI001A9E3792|nr:DUF2786 domain-containing protein [Streptomyces sp. VRA16 Mangrove soil]MBO1333823.1 DUF2786 domain-containing protein [Streptomyces sp. VRA16 Mangrove soil]